MRARRSVDGGDALIECGDGGDWLIFVDGPDAILKIGDEGECIGAGMHQEVDSDDAGSLVEGCVDLGLGLRVKRCFPNVSYNTDDLTPNGTIGGEVRGKSFANGIDAAEVFFGESFIDDENRNRFAHSKHLCTLNLT